MTASPTSTTTATPVEHRLSVTGLTAGYAGLTVLHDVDLSVDEGEIVAVLGPNGAGKSTLLMTIAGVLRPDAGTVRVLGVEGHRSAYRQARHGVGFVPSGRGLFAGLSVRENIRIRTRDRTALARTIELFPPLERLLDRRTGLLSGGEQQMLALAAVLVMRPQLLLVDEMSMGLAPTVVRTLLPVIRQVAQADGIGVVLVEQHAPAAADVADRIVILSRGRIVHETDAASVRADPDQLTAFYLGEASAEG